MANKMSCSSGGSINKHDQQHGDGTSITTENGSCNSSTSSFSSPDHPQHTGPAALWTAVFDYEATADEELTLCRGDLLEVLSRDSNVSGDEGWWTGKIKDKVGIFPSNYVIWDPNYTKIHGSLMKECPLPLEIDFQDVLVIL
ncbi:UNVERIFIED_CONTAM: hypothetical protein FKN15_051541 [Acipenser sinensis]